MHNGFLSALNRKSGEKTLLIKLALVPWQSFSSAELLLTQESFCPVAHIVMHFFVVKIAAHLETFFWRAKVEIGRKWRRVFFYKPDQFDNEHCKI